MQKTTLKNLYNVVGDSYKKNRSKTNAEYTEIPTVILLAGRVKGKKVFDAGCGLGKHSFELIKRGAIVTGVDISDKMVKFTKELCKNKGDFFVADFTKVDFKPKSFDLIIASYSIHYLKDIDSVLRKFKKFLKPRGKIIFSIYHPIRFYDKIDKFNYSKSNKYWFRLKGYGVDVFNYYHPLEKYIDAIVKNGFELKKIVEPVIPTKIQGFDEQKYRIPSAMIFEIVRK